MGRGRSLHGGQGGRGGRGGRGAGLLSATPGCGRGTTTLASSPNVSRALSWASAPDPTYVPKLGQGDAGPRPCLDRSPHARPGRWQFPHRTLESKPDVGFGAPSSPTPLPSDPEPSRLPERRPPCPRLGDWPGARRPPRPPLPGCPRAQGQGCTALDGGRVPRASPQPPWTRSCRKLCRGARASLLSRLSSPGRDPRAPASHHYSVVTAGVPARWPCQGLAPAALPRGRAMGAGGLACHQERAPGLRGAREARPSEEPARFPLSLSLFLSTPASPPRWQRRRKSGDRLGRRPAFVAARASEPPRVPGNRAPRGAQPAGRAGRPRPGPQVQPVLNEPGSASRWIFICF